MELADVVDSKSTGATRAGSSPAAGTRATVSLLFFLFKNNKKKERFLQTLPIFEGENLQSFLFIYLILNVRPEENFFTNFTVLKIVLTVFITSGADWVI